MLHLHFHGIHLQMSALLVMHMEGGAMRATASKHRKYLWEYGNMFPCGFGSNFISPLFYHLPARIMDFGGRGACLFHGWRITSMG